MNYSIDFDGKSVIEVMALSPEKLTFRTIKFWVTLEGGYIDDKCIIRKGNAVNRAAEYEAEQALRKQRSLNRLFNIKDYESMINHDVMIRDGLAKGSYLLSKDERVMAGIAEYTPSELKKKKESLHILKMATDKMYRMTYKKEHPWEFRDDKSQGTMDCYPGWVVRKKKKTGGNIRIHYSVKDCSSMKDVMEKYGNNPKANFMRVLQLCLEAGLI